MTVKKCILSALRELVNENRRLLHTLDLTKNSSNTLEVTDSGNCIKMFRKVEEPV